MTAKQFKEFADLFAKGFRPYTGEVEGNVYDRLKCEDSARAYWIAKWPLLYCFGCGRRCVPKSPQGFQVMLPEGPVRGYGPHALTPAELLRSKSLLRADEAAYCLRVSPRKVYALAAEGRLVAHIDKPLRVTVESVKEEMNRVDM